MLPTPPTPYAPTASQKFAAGQETPSRAGELARTVFSAGFGVRWKCQALPSQRSARVTVSPEVARLDPTAAQASAAEQEMELSWPPGTVAFGEFWILHARWAVAVPVVAVSAGAAVAAAGVPAKTGVSAHATSPTPSRPTAFRRPQPRTAPPQIPGLCPPPRSG